MLEFINYDKLRPWERDIVNKYPAIYSEPNPRLRDFYSEEEYQELIKNPQFTNLRYGFEFDRGWASLVDDFSQKAQQLVYALRRSDLQPDAYIHACIFKEKMGELTWQGNDNLDEPFRSLFRAYTIEMERLSHNLCEITGEIGCLCVRGHWMKTLCYAEAKKLGYKPTIQYYQKQWKHFDETQVEQPKI